MAEAPRNGHETTVPEGLLARLAVWPPDPVRPAEVARGRRRARDRAYDDGDVVREIASQLLLLSR